MESLDDLAGGQPIRSVPRNGGAIDQVEALAGVAEPRARGRSGYWQSLKPLLLDGLIEGPRVHDARIAALCLLHGVGELWSADRDFSRFPELKVRNPLVG